MATFLLLLLCLIGATSFRFTPPLAFRKLNRRPPCFQCGSFVPKQPPPPPPITLVVLPNSATPLDEIIAFIQWWGTTQVQRDLMVHSLVSYCDFSLLSAWIHLRLSCLFAQNTPKGVQFRLENIDMSILDLVAEKFGADIKIQVLNNFEERAQVLAVYPQIASKVDGIVEKYVNNLANHFGAKFVSEDLKGKPGAEPTPVAKQVQQKGNLEMLKAFSERHTSDADGVLDKKLGKTPTLADINSLWVEEPLTPEDEELYAKCAAGEQLPEQPREFDLENLMKEAYEKLEGKK